MLIKNFLFHRVTSEKDPLWPPMQPELFERIIVKLNKNYHLINLENFLDGDKPYSQKPLASILFDDGYKDNIEFAAPILIKHKSPASFYIVTDCIEYNLPTWTYLFDYTFIQTQKTSFKLTDTIYFELNKKFDISDESKRIKVAALLKPKLKKMPYAEQQNILNQIYDQLNDVALPKLMMNWKEVNQLKAEGFTIGSHGKAHAMLGQLESYDELQNELELSARSIEHNTGVFPKSISYPVGSYNEQVKQIAKKCGYKYGLAVKQQFFNYGIDDQYEIPRVELYNESWLKTNLRMNGWLEKIKSTIPK